VIRINLIPPEILQRRRDEGRWRWVWIGGGVLAIVLVLFWGVMFLTVASSSTDVASIQQQATGLQAQTSRFQLFQAQQNDLAARQAAVAAATQGRIDWATLLDDVGLVLPTDIYLTSFTGTDAGAGANSAVTLAGKAIPDEDGTTDGGYKPVAKMLVRLADLSQLDSVWLTNMAVDPAVVGQGTTISWAANARITPSATSTAN
jgi:Tfp pilus assembly protein PilN